MKDTENEPRVYNADEVFNFEDELTGRANIDWQCIDGTTRSYIELDTGKDYGTTTWDEKAGLYIERADSYSRDYPIILAIGGAYNDVLNNIAEHKNLYPSVDAIAERYNDSTDYSKRFSNPEEVGLIGFQSEEDVNKFIIDTFDKHLYDRAFNQMIAEGTFMDNQTIEYLISDDGINPAWKNEEGKCAFDYDTDTANRIRLLYKDKEWQIPVAEPATNTSEPHCTVERVPFGAWMARPENAAMRPLIGSLKEYKEIPLYVYAITNAPNGHSGSAAAISINSHPGRKPIAAFSMCCLENGHKDASGKVQMVYRDHTNDYDNFHDAQQRALGHVLSGVGIDVNNKKQYTLETKSFKSDKDLRDAYFKIVKAYATRSQDKDLGGILTAGSSALEHFSTDENKRLSNTFKSLGVNDSKRLGEILVRAIQSVTKQRNKSKGTGHER